MSTMGGHQPRDSVPSARRVYVAFCVAVAIWLAGTCWALFKLDEAERDQKAWMTKCIEFQSEQRCWELMRNDRRDLMMRKVGERIQTSSENTA